MAEITEILPAKLAIPRFKENEARVQDFVNGNDVGYYTTNTDGSKVETLPHFMCRLKDRYLQATMKGNWKANTAYGQNDLVYSNGVWYAVTNPYTSSGNINTDIANGNLIVWSMKIGKGLLVDETGATGVSLNIDEGLEFNANNQLQVKIQDGTAILFDSNGALYVDFSAMPTDKFEELLKQIRVPIWLTKNTNFYVNGATGSDSLTSGRGETPTNPFKTIQACLNYVCSNYNIDKYNCTINIASGTYTEQVTLKKYNSVGGSIRLQGENDYTTIISYTGIGYTLTTENGAGLYYLNHLCVLGTASNNPAGEGALNISDGCEIQSRDNIFQTTSLATTLQATCSVVATSGGRFYIGAGNDKTWINAILQGHTTKNLIGLYVNGGSMLTQNTAILSIEGIYNTILNASNLGTFQTTSTFTIETIGTVLGKRYNVTQNSIVNTRGRGANFFPGDTAGTISYGGQYL